MIIRASCLSATFVARCRRVRAGQCDRDPRHQPGVVYNAGLLDLAASFTKETGTKVTVTSSGMGRIVNDIKTLTPAPDVFFCRSS
jgi:hypothetical protein